MLAAPIQIYHENLSVSFKLHLPVGASPSLVTTASRLLYKQTDTPPGVYLVVFSGVSQGVFFLASAEPPEAENAESIKKNRFRRG